MTEKGSSGSPIFLEGKRKVIGIHKEGDPVNRVNFGDFIEPIISILTKEIMARFNQMQVNNNPIVINNNNVSLNSYHSFGKVSNYNNNSNFLLGPIYPKNNNNINMIRDINIIQNNQDVGQINSENDERYAGQLVNGLRHGRGAVYFKSSGKVKYEGDFVYGKYEGYGELYNKDETIKYKGVFKNNKYDGNGK